MFSFSLNSIAPSDPNVGSHSTLSNDLPHRYVPRQAANQRGAVGECDHHSRVFHCRENPSRSAAEVLRRRRRHCLRHMSTTRCGRRQCNGLLRTMPYLCASALLRYRRYSHWQMALSALLDPATAQLHSLSEVGETLFPSLEQTNDLLCFSSLRDRAAR